MLSSYTVHDVRPNATGTAGTFVVDAHSPEDAAMRALGLDLVRTGHKNDMQAKVFFKVNGRAEVLVRLYSKNPSAGMPPLRQNGL